MPNLITFRNKIIIGRREKLDFPELGLYDIPAKIDTGAYTSAIHCHEVRETRKKGKKHVCFKLLDPEHPAYMEKEICLPLIRQKTVKSSFGNKEIRYVVKTKIRLFKKIYETELSLADRSKMEVPVLIGRKLLNNNFVVDTTRYHLSHKHKIASQKKNQQAED
jgi:hypothetical protein